MTFWLKLLAAVLSPAARLHRWAEEELLDREWAREVLSHPDSEPEAAIFPDERPDEYEEFWEPTEEREPWPIDEPESVLPPPVPAWTPAPIEPGSDPEPESVVSDLDTQLFDPLTDPEFGFDPFDCEDAPTYLDALRATDWSLAGVYDEPHPTDRPIADVDDATREAWIDATGTSQDPGVTLQS